MVILHAQTPTVSASGIYEDSKYCSQITLSWTSGNGSQRIVVASKGAAVTSLPANNNYYLENDSFGLGHSFSANEFVVYNGTGNTVVIELLESNTEYHFAIFEYNGGGTTFSYQTTGYSTFIDTTEDLTIDFTIDDPHQCERGNLSTFTSSFTQTVSGAINYAWDFDDGASSNLQHPTYSFTNFDIYNVVLTASTYRCIATVTRPDSVAPEPIVSFGLDNTISGNVQQQCLLNADGSSNYFKFIKVFDGSSLGTSFSRYRNYWDFGDGTTDFGVGNGNVTYTSSGTYTVRLVTVGTHNDIDFCIDSFDFIVEVRPKPIDTSLLAYDTAHCENGNIFSFVNNTPDLATICMWDFGDGTTDIGLSVNHSYGASGKYEVTLEVEDVNGCYDIFQDSVEVVPQPNNDFSGLAVRYCLGDPISILIPTLLNGTWFGDNVDPATGEFNPIQLGLNTISHAVEESGCKDTVIHSTTVFPVPNFELGIDTSICIGTDFVRRIQKGLSNVSWSTGASDSFTTVSSDGILWAEKIEGGCSFRDSIRVTEIRPPSVNLGIDSLLCGDGIRAVDVRASEATYSWNDGYSGGGLRNITETGVYSVTVVNKCGTASDDVDLEFLPYVCDIFIPSAFSPNGDGRNDVFRPSGNVELLSLQIFNRWGELLYQNSETDFAWDGFYQNSEAQMGHYYFIIRYLLPVDGTQLPKTEGGVLYLIR